MDELKKELELLKFECSEFNDCKNFIMLDSFKYELKLLSVLDMLKNFRYEFRDVYCGIINVNMSEKSKKIVYNGDMFLVLNENIFEIVFDDK